MTGEGREVVVEVELAQTEEQRRKGLMYRKELPENKGMLFIMAYSENQRFWMKNTFLPLDMVFISEDFKIAGILENTATESTTSYEIGRPSRYVLEVNAGFCARNKIGQGDAVTFAGFKAE